MFGLATLSGPVHAGAIVGIVLAEALVLNLGYGSLSRWAGPELADALRKR